MIRKFFTGLKTACLWFFGLIFLLVVVLLLFVMFFGAPIEVAIQSYELARMRSTADGTILESRVEHNEGLPRSAVEYRFEAGGIEFTSQRVTPGRFLHRTYSSDGDAAARRFAPKQRVTVHYDAANPSRCSLFYGWHKWAIGWMLAVWGIVFSGVTGWVGRGGRASVLYSLGLLFFGPPAVLIPDLHLHLLALFAAAVVAWVCPWIFEPKKREQKSRKATVSIDF